MISTSLFHSHSLSHLRMFSSDNESLSKVNISRESSLLAPQFPPPGTESTSTSRLSGPWEKKICLEPQVALRENINR